MKTMLSEHLRAKKSICSYALLLAQCAFCAMATPVLAVPETSSVRITDVTPSSFSVVWMTDAAADPSVEVYADNSLQQRITEGISVTPMPSGSGEAAQAARSKGIMKVRVSDVRPATTYFVRTVTTDPLHPDSVGYSSLQQVTTATSVDLYRLVNGSEQALANDLVAFSVYIRPSDTSAAPGLGDLIILEGQDSPYPVSAFAGDGTVSPEGILDLNNLFGNDGSNLPVAGSERIMLRIYRAGSLPTLTHYRKAPQNSGWVSLAEPLSGFFADINLDGRIDDQDFGTFRPQYKTLPDDAVYNPDYNFVDDAENVVDVREFSTFAKEYGRTDVQ